MPPNCCDIDLTAFAQKVWAHCFGPNMGLQCPNDEQNHPFGAICGPNGLGFLLESCCLWWLMTGAAMPHTYPEEGQIGDVFPIHVCIYALNLRISGHQSKY